LAVVARPGPLLPRSRVLSPAMAQWPTVGVRAAVWADVAFGGPLLRSRSGSRPARRRSPPRRRPAHHERADAEQDRDRGDLPGMNGLMPSSPTWVARRCGWVTVSVGGDGRMRPLFLSLSSLPSLFLKG